MEASPVTRAERSSVAQLNEKILSGASLTGTATLNIKRENPVLPADMKSA